MTKRKLGFTLAEVLITLAVIGIVAVLTMPGLVQKYDEYVRVTQLKKFYSVMLQAFNLAIVEHGTVNNWNLIPSVVLDEDGENAEAYAEAIKNKDAFWARVLPHLKVVETNKFADVANLNTWNTYNMLGTTLLTAKTANYIVLNDGMTIVSTWFSNACSEVIATNLKSCGDFLVDLNGAKKPNRSGVDIFSFWITKNGIIPMGAENDTIRPFDTFCAGTKTNQYDGYGCTAWVIQNGNQDYLRCRDKLSWSGKRKCGD